MLRKKLVFCKENWVSYQLFIYAVRAVFGLPAKSRYSQLGSGSGSRFASEFSHSHGPLHFFFFFLVRVTIVIKHLSEKAIWGRKGLFHSNFHIPVYHQRHWGQELKQNKNMESGAEAEAMESAAYWLYPHCFLLAPRLPSQDWPYPHQSLIHTMPYRLAYSLVLWSRFL